MFRVQRIRECCVFNVNSKYAVEKLSGTVVKYAEKETTVTETEQYFNPYYGYGLYQRSSSHVLQSSKMWLLSEGGREYSFASNRYWNVREGSRVDLYVLRDKKKGRSWILAVRNLDSRTYQTDMNGPVPRSVKILLLWLVLYVFLYYKYHYFLWKLGVTMPDVHMALDAFQPFWWPVGVVAAIFAWRTLRFRSKVRGFVTRGLRGAAS